MPKRPAYFDSQAAAAASLGIDIDVLRQAKREGCPAFRSGRVYGDELRSWLQEDELRKIKSAASSTTESDKRHCVLAQTIRDISACADLGVLTAEQYFDFCHTIVEQADDPEVRELFRRTILDWLQLNFSELAIGKARRAHPKIVSWFTSETAASLLGESGRGDIRTETADD